MQAHLFAFTGARLGSIAELRWCDVDFEGEQLYFDTAKFDRAYSVPMHPELAIELLRWQRAQRRQAAQNELVPVRSPVPTRPCS